jgi:hypothetical protein
MRDQDLDGDVWWRLAADIVCIRTSCSHFGTSTTGVGQEEAPFCIVTIVMIGGHESGLGSCLVEDFIPVDPHWYALLDKVDTNFGQQPASELVHDWHHRVDHRVDFPNGIIRHQP